MLKPKFYIPIKVVLILWINLVVSTVGKGQQSNHVLSKKITIKEVNKVSHLDGCLAISGLCYVENQLVLVAENSGMILFVDDVKTRKITQQFKLTKSDSFELEAISYWDGYYYVTDEKNECVYQLDLKYKTGKRLAIGSFKVKYGGSGLEGIAINKQQKLFYLLLEKNKEEEYAKIFICKLDDKSDQLIPLGANASESTLLLPLLEEGGGWRYSGIHYSEKDNCIYALKTRKGAYWIMKISLNKDGIPICNQQGRVASSVKEILINTIHSNYNTNIEGITQDKNGDFVVVSDNMDGSCCNKKTLLLRIPYK